MPYGIVFVAISVNTHFAGILQDASLTLITMKTLTTEGRHIIEETAKRHGLEFQTVEALLNAIVKGHGTMAQFNIPELGGAGQWMKGGMNMIGDMFNHGLKVKVEQVASELSDLVSTRVIFTSEENDPAYQSEYQSDSALVEVKPGSAWPTVFGNPTASGSQNNFRYAYFAPKHRLVVEEDGKRSIYDTKHHHISGVAQQQGNSRSYRFTSQEGEIDLSDLTLISEPADKIQETPDIPYDVTHAYSNPNETPLRTPEEIIISTIEKLNVLLERGQITEEEFSTKKTELLSRL